MLAFLVIGLELGAVLAAAQPGELERWALVGGAVLATVIAVRLLWTVATALALPLDFPNRGLLLFAAFTVTLGTLLIQGLTLRLLVLALDVPTNLRSTRRSAKLALQRRKPRSQR